MDMFDDASVDGIIKALEVAPPVSIIQLRVFGGAMCRVPAEATAFPHRNAMVQVTIINLSVDPASVDEVTAWNRALFAALEPRGPGVYANFLEDEGESRIRDAYPGGTCERLGAIKRRYDTANVFHRNQNIRPA
ncbi:MAG: BBE domain-containing protein [Chloroflexota bacterium]|nr:BBE domain-containing protein [Chloroflexota bacterium]